MIVSYKTLLLPTLSSNTPAMLATAKDSMLKAATTTFAEEIKNAETLVGIKKEFFLPFGQHETQWRNVQNSKGGSAAGPMQIMPGTCVDAICSASSFLNAATRNKLISLLGATRANGYLKPNMEAAKAMRTYGKITVQELLQKPELSILCAVIELAYLCRKNTKNGTIDVIRVLLQYSEGENAKLVTNTPDLQLKEIKVRHKKQSYDYAISMVGKNGLMTAFSA